MNIRLLITVMTLLCFGSCKGAKDGITNSSKVDTAVSITVNYDLKGTHLPFQIKDSMYGMIPDNVMLSFIDDEVSISITDTGAGSVKIWDNHQDTFFKVKLNVTKPADFNTVQSIVSRQNKDELLNNRVADRRWQLALLNKPVPAFSLNGIKGDTLTADRLNGRISVLNFWYLGCGACELENPELNDLVEQYQGQNVIFYSLCLDSGYSKNGHTYFNGHKYNPVTGKTEKVFQRETLKTENYIQAEKLEPVFNVMGYPKTFVVDENGYVRYIMTGYGENSKEVLNRQIQFLQRFKRISE